MKYTFDNLLRAIGSQFGQVIDVFFDHEIRADFVLQIDRHRYKSNAWNFDLIWQTFKV